MGTFEDLGIPVIRPDLKGLVLGPRPADQTGSPVWVYLNCQQSAGHLFLLGIDPSDGRTVQFDAPDGPGAWAFTVGPDGCLYFGTWEPALILRFDPAHPDRGIQSLGRPAPSETYIWQFAQGPDGQLYAGTYPSAHLVRIQMEQGILEDLGRLDTEQMYARFLLADTDGTLYAGIGYGRADVVAIDAVSGRRSGLLTPEQRDAHTVAHLRLGADGHVYARLGASWWRCGREGLSPSAPPEEPAPPQLPDGWSVHARLDGAGHGALSLSRGAEERTVAFHYRGSGCLVFAVSTGPDGKVYGSSYLPMDLFRYDPDSGTLADLGSPGPGGQIYSFAHTGGLLYLCSYPESVLRVYDTNLPWHPGREPGDNPRQWGPAGDGHLRPTAMCTDGSGRLWIGSFPPYGQWGGALAVFDPKTGRFSGNWRNLIPNQAIQSLCFEPVTQWIWGGSNRAGGDGTAPRETDAHLFAWDPVAEKKTVDQVLSGTHGIAAMVSAAGLLLLVLRPGEWLLSMDPLSGTEHWRIALPGKVPAHSLCLGDDGYVWALAGDRIVRIEPRHGVLQEVASAPTGISCGMALTPTALYFGSGAHLWRYRR